ncbi:MAG: hypothetical protein ACI906_000138 [Candidatus Latescibacterota bacterium]|jgi:hypothetical protein
MNIDRVAPRAAEIGVRRTESPRRAFDLTVSDQGVEERREVAPAPRETPAVASTPEMQELLSIEETSALHEAFFVAEKAESPVQAPRPGGVYNLRGQAAQRTSQISSGAMLDITG